MSNISEVVGRASCDCPMVSIVMPAFNSERFIFQAIDSVVTQKDSALELIVVNDCSTDDTASIVSEFCHADSRVRMIHLSVNSGAARARNAGILSARGRYIAFLDADDIWYADKLSRQIEVLQQGYPFVFSAYDVISEDGGKIGSRPVPKRATYHKLLSHNVIGTLTAMYDTHHFGKVLMPDIRKRQDLGLWLELLRNGGEAYGIQEPLGAYRVRKGSISSNKLEASRYTWQLYRHVEKLPLPKACYYFGRYATQGVVRSLKERALKAIMHKRSEPRT